MKLIQACGSGGEKIVSSLWNELIYSHLYCVNKSLQADRNGVRSLVLCVPPPSTDSPPWLSKELAELPHPSSTLLQIRFSFHPPRSSAPAVPHNTSLKLTRDKGFSTEESSQHWKMKMRELCQCAMARYNLSQDPEMLSGHGGGEMDSFLGKSRKLELRT